MLEREDLGHWPYLEDTVGARSAMKRFFIDDPKGVPTVGGSIRTSAKL